MARSYLDHASTSPLRPEARAALLAALGAIGPDGAGSTQPIGGDPGRIHEEGLTARHALEVAREQVANFLGARSRSVVFTSGATEAIAAAVWGATERGAAGPTGGGGATVSATAHHVVSAVEHSAVRLSAARAGAVTLVPVDRGGRVDAESVLAAITSDTVAVHVQWGNHEVGTIQPVGELAAACRERGVLLHVDAAQAAGRVVIDFDGSGIDLLSISGHKLGGPAGTGALLVRRGLRVPPLLLGGDQERARRAGLEPVAALVGLGAACAALAGTGLPNNLDDYRGLGFGGFEVERAESVRLTDRIREVARGIDGIVEYGDPDPEHRLPHIVCLGIDGVEPQGVLLGLDRAGIAAHSGSSCASESLEPSPVLEAMGVDAHHSLRLSVGWNTTDADIDRLAEALPRVVGHLRSLAAG